MERYTKYNLSEETIMLINEEKTVDITNSNMTEKGTVPQRIRSCARNNLLLVLLANAMFVGLGMGMLIRHVDPEMSHDKRRIMYLEFPGILLMRMLKMLILPIIVTSLVSGIAKLPTGNAGKLGLVSFCYYISTMLIAVITGLILVSLIQPGHTSAHLRGSSQDGMHIEAVDAFMDLLRNIFPSNLVSAAFQQTHTKYILNDTTTYDETTNTTVNRTEVLDFYQDVGGETNVLGLVMFSIAFGIAIGLVGENAAILKSFFCAFHETILKLVSGVIWYSPVGIAFLLAGRIVEMEDPMTSFGQLAFYMLTVFLGLVIHMCITLMLLYLAITRRSPCSMLADMSEALLTAFGTASSSVTLPVTLRCLEEKSMISPLVTRFVAPVGAVINMDGTALYEAVATVFIAQYNHIPLNVGQLFTVGITSVAAAIGAASVPEAGLVTLVIVLTSVGLPIDDIGLLLAVDWILDRCRTMVNVWGDAIGAGIAETLCAKDLGIEIQTKTADETNEKTPIISNRN